MKFHAAHHQTDNRELIKHQWLEYICAAFDATLHGQSLIKSRGGLPLHNPVSWAR